MTDLEKIELSIRRVAERSAGSVIGYWLYQLAEQIAKDQAARAVESP